MSILRILWFAISATYKLPNSAEDADAEILVADTDKAEVDT
jgi:hypothetical protein